MNAASYVMRLTPDQCSYPGPRTWTYSVGRSCSTRGRNHKYLRNFSCRTWKEDTSLEIYFCM